MSTRVRKPRCVVCRNVLPENARTNKCGPCRGQTVLFPLRTARSLTRRTSTGGRVR